MGSRGWRAARGAERAQPGACLPNVRGASVSEIPADCEAAVTCGDRHSPTVPQSAHVSSRHPDPPTHQASGSHCRCTAAPLHRCTTAPLHRCTAAQCHVAQIWLTCPDVVGRSSLGISLIIIPMKSTHGSVPFKQCS